MKKLLLVIFVTSLILAVLTGCERGGRQREDGIFVIRGAVANPPPHPKVYGMQKLSDLLYERSGGRIRLDVFHSGQLGSERDLIEGLQLNTIHFAFVTSAPLSGFTNAYNVFDLPFLFENVEEARQFMDSQYGVRILASLENDGIIGLGFGENGFRHITNSRRPIVTPEDLRGIRIRTMENPIHMESFRIMGADPTPMAFGELFTALQQGAIDAQENPYVVIASSRFYEAQPFLSVTGHVYSPVPLLMSRTFYDSLPTDLQQIVREVGLEASFYQRSVIDRQSATLLDYFQDIGIQINFVDIAPFVAATRPVYDRFIGNLIPQQAFDDVMRFLNNVRN